MADVDSFEDLLQNNRSNLNMENNDNEILFIRQSFNADKIGISDKFYEFLKIENMRYLIYDGNEFKGFHSGDKLMMAWDGGLFKKEQI